MIKMLAAPLSALLCGAALAAPVTYKIDSSHTYPSFEADHFGGLSKWRGKINESAGTIVLDREAKTGTVEVTMNMATLDFGHDRMNEHAKSADMFDVEKFPTATFRGTLGKFDGDRPTEVAGQLTLHGVTRPVTLRIEEFVCKPVRNVETCGADASATINRSDFGVSYGTQMGFKPEVTLQIQVEAARAN